MIEINSKMYEIVHSGFNKLSNEKINENIIDFKEHPVIIKHENYKYDILKDAKNQLLLNTWKENNKAMKTILKVIIIPFCALGIAFGMFGCKKLNIDNELRIDIGTLFNNDYVSIKLDNDEVFSGNVSTNQLLGVGEILIFDYPIGRYELTVNINGIEKKEKFRHKKNRFVYISFDKALSEITIIYPDKKYVYD